MSRVSTIEGYSAIHKWIAYNFEKTGTCLHCAKTNLTGKKIHWANISGEYKRDISDWKELCAGCHQKFDHRYKEGELMFTECLNCEEIFRISPSRVGKKFYCSNDCYAEVRRGIKKSRFWSDLAMNRRIV